MDAAGFHLLEAAKTIAEAVMRTRDSFGEAMEAVWRAYLSESVRAGDPLVVQDIAAVARLSATPVREALAWLAGQGLIERWIGRGYFIPVLSAEALSQLYRLHGRYLAWALEIGGSPRVPQPAPGSSDLAERTAWLFRGVVASSGDTALAGAQARVAARLRLLRRVESQVCPQDPGAVAEAEEAFLTGKGAIVGRFIDQHHQSRMENVLELCALMRRDGENIDQI